jgi:sulfide:quinone oxidoreductase
MPTLARTFVGAGLSPFADSARPLSSVLPANAVHYPVAAATFEPEENQVTLADGNKLTYETLIVAPGIQLDWGKVKGLSEALQNKASNVVSIYTADYVQNAAEQIQKFNGGTAVFTQPST